MCKKEDDVKGLFVTEMSFVYIDGTEILANDCIDSADGYAISIEVDSDNNSFNELNVKYMVNGVSYTMRFDKTGKKLQAIQLQKGNNFAKIVKYDFTDYVNFKQQGEFVLVN
ncbi:MAG: hypothetical protein COB98_03115 [Flavobacteriaceae bacterium]|nr:MAG: hypothetical protein COB98_03115 [Flavobacteriaceae bacterium]